MLGGHREELGDAGVVHGVGNGQAVVQHVLFQRALVLHRRHAHARGVHEQLGSGHGSAQVVLVVQVVQRDVAAGLRRKVADALFGRVVEVVADVEDVDLLDAVQGGLREDGRARAARADDGHLLADDVHAVLLEVAHEAGAVGVVPDGLSVLHDHRVDGAHELGGVGQLVKVGEDQGLERHGDVVAGHAHGLHALDDRFEIVGLHVVDEVGVVEPQLVERGVVHGRRHRVLDRAADERDSLGVSRDAQFFSHEILLRLPTIDYHGPIIPQTAAANPIGLFPG